MLFYSVDHLASVTETIKTNTHIIESGEREKKRRVPINSVLQYFDHNCVWHKRFVGKKTTKKNRITISFVFPSIYLSDSKYKIDNSVNVDVAS